MIADTETKDKDIRREVWDIVVKKVEVEHDKENSSGKICKVCDEIIPRDMARHMRTHTGEKPHICPKCGMAFTRSDARNTHQDGCGENRKRGRPPREEGDLVNSRRTRRRV